MKKAPSSGRMLAICLPALIVAVAAEPAVAVASMQKTQPGAVALHHMEGAQYVSSLSTPAVLEVRAVADGAIAATATSGSLVDALHETLSSTYGSRFVATQEFIGYRWVWNGEKWVWVCEESLTGEVDFGTRGTVVVEARDTDMG